jgi:putative membrane protein
VFGLPVTTLPAVNASLNALATVLLIAGYVLIKQRRETAHKWIMLTAFAVSVLFLACYLVYHAQAGSKPFAGPPPISYLYYSILISHVILAATVPVLAGLTIWWGYTDQRLRHVRLARWTFPIWLYVSITGVVIYWMLYQLYPAISEPVIIAGGS